MKSTKNNIDKNFREISDKLILLYKNNENKIDINFYDKKIKELIGKFNKENPLINNFDLSENTVVLISYADNIYLNNKKQTLNTEKHALIVSSHPSPLSAQKMFKSYPKFMDSKPFSTINNVLQQQEIPEINW